jgi:hypothetical protein
MLRAFLFAALTAGGCATARPDAAPETAPTVPTADSEPAPPADPDSPVRLALGETLRMSDTAVQFAAVEEDSRCPQGTTCVWEGRARVRLIVAGAPVVLTIPPGGPARPDEPSSAVRGPLFVEVTALGPAPGTAEANAPAVVTLTVRPVVR